MVNAEKFLQIKNFLKHQVINKPTKSNIPPPQKYSFSSSTTAPLPEDSGSTTVVLPEDYGTEGQGGEGKGREEEWNGREGKGINTREVFGSSAQTSEPEGSSRPQNPKAAEICKAMRANGISDVNPQHPRLLKLVEAGASIDEFIFAAEQTATHGKRFSYALGIVEGRRSDLAKGFKGVPSGRTLAQEPAWRTEQRNRTLIAVPSIAEGAATQQQNPVEIIDVKATNVTTLALG
jgi:hypothetical protein